METTTDDYREHFLDDAFKDVLSIEKFAGLIGLGGNLPDHFYMKDDKGNPPYSDPNIGMIILVISWGEKLEIPFTVAYGEDLSKARSLVTEAVTALEAVYDDPEPVCYIHTLGGDGAEFRMRYYHDFDSRIATRDEVAQTIIDTLLAADIKLGTPEIIVHQQPQD